jgi:signal transduction histidine kinase
LVSPTTTAYAAVKVSAALRQAALRTSQPRRIWVTLGVDPVVAGSYVGAVSEIMAELLTNAISFSPPQARVDLTTAVVPGGIRIDIADLGPGLDEAQVAAYNQALTSVAGLSTLPPSGLARVGRLVHQLGGRVALTNQGRTAGLTAAVALPDKLFHWPVNKDR